MTCLVYAAVLVPVAAAGVWVVAVTADPTTVYVVHGHSWRRPLRVGITRAADWDDYRRCGAHGDCRRHRLCSYLTGRDVGSRSDEWAWEVDWHAPPRRWPAIRRRHRVLYLTVPWRPLALRVEKRLIRRYHPEWNTHHIPAVVLARRRRSRTP